MTAINRIPDPPPPAGAAAAAAGDGEHSGAVSEDARSAREWIADLDQRLGGGVLCGLDHILEPWVHRIRQAERRLIAAERARAAQEPLRALIARVRRERTVEAAEALCVHLEARPRDG